MLTVVVTRVVFQFKVFGEASAPTAVTSWNMLTKLVADLVFQMDTSSPDRDVQL